MRRGSASASEPAPHELTSLDERLGLLLLVRVAFVVLVVAGSLWASDVVGLDAAGAAPVSAVYVLLAGAAEWYRRTGFRGRMRVHRSVIPLDAVYLAVVSAPSGGPRSPLVVLFAVQLISVTLLHSARAGLRTALWDSFLFIAIPSLSLTGRIGAAMGLHEVANPPTSETTVAVMGFWLVAICTAVFSSVSERELRRGKTEMAALAELAAAVEKVRDEGEILGILLHSVTRTFGFRRGAIWYRRRSGPIVINLPTGGGAVLAHPTDTPARPDRIMNQVWGSREPQLVRSLDRDVDPVCSGLLPGAYNVVAVPIQVEGGDAGLLLLEYGGSVLNARIPRRILVMVAQFTAHACLAVTNARLLVERERLAAIDGLTGLANRREFDRVVARELSRAGRAREPLSLAVFDVDHFKKVNDTRGHLGGDEVLRAVARVLAGSVRDMDVVARYGGEEFAVILPVCDQRDAVRVVERVMASVRSEPALQGITLSAGVATAPFNAGDVRSLVEAADEAMYASKRAGRDRYSISGRHQAGSPRA